MKKQLELHQKQTEVINSLKRYKLLNWGRRSGKTTVVGYEIMITLWNEPGLVSYYAPTHSDARDIAWDIYKDILAPITIKTNESLLEITVKNHQGTESLLRLTGWEAVKNRDKGRGVENNLVVLDECAFFPLFKEKFEKVIEPTLLTTKGRLIICSTPNGFNHFYDYANLAQQNEEWFYSHATSYDNPFNDPNELYRLREQKEEDAFAQEYMADFRKMQGLVYKSFDRTRHVYNDIVFNPSETLVGVDWGWTNPAAILKVVRDTDNNFYVTEEWYKTEKTTDEIIEVASSFKGHKYYPDPAEPDRIDLMRKAKLNVRDVSKDIEAGISAVQELFKTNRLFIHASCTNLIWELETYAYPDKKEDHNESELPIKENDHALDALRYVLYMQSQTILRSAHVHYSQSAAPMENQAGLPLKPKFAHVHIPKL